MDPVEERLASYYLGQEYDLGDGEMSDELVHYDARDLTTHAVCLGMTGSGKTGLGVILLEEAALDGIPSLVIDPKGDMTNLLLTFPDLLPEDFEPWINPDDARRKGMDITAYAARTADQWREGLVGTGQGPDRIRRLKESAEFEIYTPGSSAGRQVSILHTLKAPDIAWDTDPELIRDKIQSVVSALLGLTGIEADPVRSREHILLSNIFEDAWRNGQDLDLAQLIMRVQKPPFAQLGVFPVETFFPEKDRMGLAILLNGLVASPSFAAWIEGQPLDIDGLLQSPLGKPQVSILYLAHLSEPEKQFFVTLLLEQVLSWMRAQSGTTSLRALLYMDEMFGYLPPHPGNPPTKKPLLTLLKQARAFGLGLILATQNPVDLDYKALSNAGTWFIGRMQADRDKQRLLDGLEGVEVGKGGTSRAEFDRMISAVKSRVFLLHNVHEDEPVVFSTRWAMSYLRGPMTRPQIQRLYGQQDAAPVAAPAPGSATASPQPVPVPGPAEKAAEPARPEVPYSQVPPQLPSAVEQVYLPVRVSLEDALQELATEQRWAPDSAQDAQGYVVYEPYLVGLARLRFPHTKSRQTGTREAAYLLPAEPSLGGLDWSQGATKLDASDLTQQGERGAYYAGLPSALGGARSLSSFQKEFSDYLYYNSTMELQFHPKLQLYSQLDESDGQFRRRVQQAAEEASDSEIEKLRSQYQKKLDQLRDRLEREERELEEDEVEHSARKQEEMLSGAESLLGVFLGRRSSSRVSSASRRRRMTRKARAEVQESEEAIERMEEEIEELKEEAQDEIDEITSRWQSLVGEVELEEVHPRRSDVQVNLFAVAWVPRWEVQAGGRVFTIPAFEVEPL